VTLNTFLREEQTTFEVNFIRLIDFFNEEKSIFLFRDLEINLFRLLLIKTLIDKIIHIFKADYNQKQQTRMKRNLKG
jgi:hypothetical protein